MNDKKATEKKPANGRLHRATYATDKMKGGYLVRVEGPNAGRFAGRSVPVMRKDNTESEETLVRLLWSDIDKESGKPVALYTFKQKPRDEDSIDQLPF